MMQSWVLCFCLVSPDLVWEYYRRPDVCITAAGHVAVRVFSFPEIKYQHRILIFDLWHLRFPTIIPKRENFLLWNQYTFTSGFLETKGFSEIWYRWCPVIDLGYPDASWRIMEIISCQIPTELQYVVCNSPLWPLIGLSLSWTHQPYTYNASFYFKI